MEEHNKHLSPLLYKIYTKLVPTVITLNNYYPYSFNSVTVDLVDLSACCVFVISFLTCWCSHDCQVTNH